jgi:hypothetical protein
MITMRNCSAAILASLFLAGSLAAQPNRCTQRTVVGTYAFAYDGTVMMAGISAPVPVAGLSIVTIDPEGAVSAPGYMAVGGAPQWYPQMPGTITVNTDCTGTVDWGGGMVGELIVQDGGVEISSIMISGGPLGSPTVTGRWKKISRVLDIHHPCSVVGTYVARQSGIDITGFGPVPDALLGRVSVGYDGTIAMSGISMPGGNPMPITLADGEWEEGELACTGSITGNIIADSPMGPIEVGKVKEWFVVLDGSNELWGIIVEGPAGDPVSLGTMKRVSRQPAGLE